MLGSKGERSGGLSGFLLSRQADESPEIRNRMKKSE